MASTVRSTSYIGFTVHQVLISPRFFLRPICLTPPLCKRPYPSFPLTSLSLVSAYFNLYSATEHKSYFPWEYYVFRFRAHFFPSPLKDEEQSATRPSLHSGKQLVFAALLNLVFDCQQQQVYSPFSDVKYQKQQFVLIHMLSLPPFCQPSATNVKRKSKRQQFLSIALLLLSIKIGH